MVDHKAVEEEDNLRLEVDSILVVLEEQPSCLHARTSLKSRRRIRQRSCACLTFLYPPLYSDVQVPLSILIIDQ